MRFGLIATIAAAAVMASLAAPADAQPRRKQVVNRSGHTYYVIRDEDGRTRTRIIVQKRSYLDPGNVVSPGERKYLDYVQLPTQHTYSPMQNTAFDIQNQIRPGPFELPSKYNPMQ
jgi:hypothetical protein